ncbi:MAG: restriction endonuclease subunit S [Paraglaciecola polaris]|uniref:restriction endonuclease subunit S n=1 Tax=Paraglaciecola polaris TaxID=222814 RepID=UPI00300321FA
MSNLSFMEKLLDGVEMEWKALGVLIKSVTAPSKLKGEAYRVTGKLPIVDQGVEFIAGYTDEDIVPIKAGKYVIFGDHSEHIKYVDFSFVQGADGIKILSPISTNAKYIYYAFQNFYKKKLSYKRHWSTAKETLIPIPCPENQKKSLEIQAEIVHILDTFTELTTELTAELIARKKQYNYYRDQLLSFDEGEVEWKTLGELTSLITKGTTPKSFESSGISFIKTEAFDGTRINKSKLSYVGETIHRTFLKRSILEEGDILFTIAGATIGKSAVVTSDLLPANTNQALAIIRLHQTVNKKYIFYILRSNHMKEYIDKSAKGSAQPNLNLRQINEFCIPLPSPEEQTRIVAILDKFDVLTSSITEGLPREMALRQQQYEYYRELLLSFPKLDSEVAA